MTFRALADVPPIVTPGGEDRHAVAGVGAGNRAGCVGADQVALDQGRRSQVRILRCRRKSLPEMTLPAPAAVPPMTRLAPPSISRPLSPLPRGSVPVASVPIRLPWNQRVVGALTGAEILRGEDAIDRVAGDQVACPDALPPIVVEGASSSSMPKKLPERGVRLRRSRCSCLAPGWRSSRSRSRDPRRSHFRKSGFAPRATCRRWCCSRRCRSRCRRSSRTDVSPVGSVPMKLPVTSSPPLPVRWMPNAELRDRKAPDGAAPGLDRDPIGKAGGESIDLDQDHRVVALRQRIGAGTRLSVAVDDRRVRDRGEAPRAERSRTGPCPGC